MTKASSRWLALNLEVCEVSMHHLSVDNDRFEVAKLILQLSFLVFASKEVDAFLYRITLIKINKKFLAIRSKLLTLPWNCSCSDDFCFVLITLQQEPWMNGVMPDFS